MAPDDTKRPAMVGMLAELNEFVATIADLEAQDAAVVRAMQTLRNYLLARYAMLATWAGLLDQPEPAKLLAAVLEDERAAIPQPMGADSPRDHSPPKGVSMGERLTALFDRKR